jgi:hypothetical protein
MDLPSNTSICNTINYFMVGGAVQNGAGVVNISGAAAGVANLTGTAVNLGVTAGPLTITNTADPAGTGGTITGTALGLCYRVYAPAGGRRVWVYAYGVNAAAQITVDAQTTYGIKILDGNVHDTKILLDSDGDNMFGDGTTANANADTIQVATAPVPTTNNTLCVNLSNMSGDLAFVSFDSLSSKFTFTGDAQIAHVASAASISLTACKGDTTANIAIGSQGTCSFDYESDTNYCTTGNNFNGNRLLITSSTTGFGEPGDTYTYRVQSNTAGVYFSAAAVMTSFASTATDYCTAGGTAVTGGTTSAAAIYLSNGTAATGYATSSCSVTSTNRVAIVSTTPGAVSGIDAVKYLYVNMPAMVYDTTQVGAATEATVTVTLDKYPCGTIFTGTRTIGTFVTTCTTTSSTTTTMVYPYLPPTTAAGWWGGIVIVNNSSAAGTATVTLYEQDGDSGSVTTSSIASKRMVTYTTTSLIAALTPTAGNTGTLGDANAYVSVSCAFGNGAGFAFLGNGEEGTGYAAYSTAWQ